MSHNILPILQNILLICSLPGVIVMDDIGHTVLISAIGDNAYMIFEYDNIPALPFFYRGNICREAYGGMGKVNPQIFHAPEINILIRFIHIIIRRICLDILLPHKLFRPKPP